MKLAAPRHKIGSIGIRATARRDQATDSLASALSDSCGSAAICAINRSLRAGGGAKSGSSSRTGSSALDGGE